MENVPIEQEHRRKLVLQYDGTDYCGWQVQPNGPTIQDELQKAWKTITGEEVAVVGAGRTDSGVHALGQVGHVRTRTKLSGEALVGGLNSQLPLAIRVRSVTSMPDDFHAQKSAVKKHYRYIMYDDRVADVFWGRYCWHHRQRLDEALMHQAGQAWVGTHDFRCFETQWPNRASSVRTVMGCEVSRRGPLVVLDTLADGFLYNMVRAMAGTLAEVGRGKRTPEQAATLVMGGDRTQAGPTAPAQGLFLVQVHYPERFSG